jgi:membrane fusion protein, multidrug efflux system
VIQVDIYLGDKLEGIVDSISRGSGSVFSLLVPQNATGNWVKVTQRVPVRVCILNPLRDKPLCIGTSAFFN